MSGPYDHRFGRTELLVGAEGVARLARARVAVFGLGGVGGYAAEALARAGVGYLRLVDGDVVEPSNLNRQIVALKSTIGRPKAEVMAERVRAINPDAAVDARCLVLDADNVAEHVAGIGYAVEAIDTVGPKCALLAALYRAGIVTVSCMGAAGKIAPDGILTADVSQTQYCPLARRVRQQLRRMGITGGIRCVYAHENRRSVHDTGGASAGKRFVQGSISHVPGLFGLTAAGHIIQEILARAE